MDELMNEQIHSSNIHCAQPCARHSEGPSDADAVLDSLDPGREKREIRGSKPSPHHRSGKATAPPPPTLIFLL